MKKFKLHIILLAIIILISIPPISLASEVKSGPELIESVPVNGATSIKVNSKLHLRFNKNIVNMSVIENNKDNIKLIDANGNEVLIDILFADDQIEPEKKRELILIPKTTLEKATNYKIQILPGFKAKNGILAGSLTELSFETEKEEPNVSEIKESKPDPTETQASETEVEKDVALIDKSSESKDNKEEIQKESPDENLAEEIDEEVDEEIEQELDTPILEQKVETQKPVEINEATIEVETQGKDKSIFRVIFILAAIIVGTLLFVKSKRS